MPYTAVLDANVLWPAALRCTLIRAGIAGLYRPVWSRRILDEMAATLHRAGRVQPPRIERTIRLMEQALPQALVEGYEDLIPVMQNDPGDRHVLAAAVRAGAGTIVTFNVRHFPAESRAPYGIDVHTPDEYLLDLWDMNSAVIAAVLQEQAAQLRNPPPTAADVVLGLGTLAPEFSRTVLEAGLAAGMEGRS